MERLQKVIAQSGVTSRRKAEELITSGKVKVNGNIVTELGTKVSSKDKIEVNNPAGTYPFILYIFSAIGFVIARIFDLNILIGCYLAKLMNLLIMVTMD